MIKTVKLDGAEVCVTGLGGQNVVIKNMGAEAIFASADKGVEQGADNVCVIPAGAGEVIFGVHGTVYLLGEGTVQVTGTDYSEVNFNAPSIGSSGGGSGGGGSDLQPATKTKLGGVIIGDGVAITPGGKISVAIEEISATDEDVDNIINSIFGN